MTDDDLEAARQQMIASRFGGVRPTHGKGASRRKKKVKSKNAAAQSDAKLSAVVNKLGATHIPGIEEVNFYRENGTVLHFKNPKVQASIAANTYVITGPNQEKTLQELLPAMVGQFGGNGGNGMDEALQHVLAQQQKQASSIPEGQEDDDDDDDDVPDLVEGNFEEVSEK